jgi:hypothetical protein
MRIHIGQQVRENIQKKNERGDDETDCQHLGSEPQWLRKTAEEVEKTKHFRLHSRRHGSEGNRLDNLRHASHRS